MGKIVLVGGTKGGTGKSTIATNLAALRAGKKSNNDIIIVDTDPQSSSLSWVKERKKKGIESVDVISLFEDSIEQDIDRVIDAYDDIIIDCGARDSKELRISMSVSDIMLVPFSVSKFGEDSADIIHNIVKEANIEYGIKLPCLVFPNIFSAHPFLTEGDECIDKLKQYRFFETIERIVHQRIAFVRSNDQGRGVNEIKDSRGRLADPTAVDELTEIYNGVYNI